MTVSHLERVHAGGGSRRLCGRSIRGTPRHEHERGGTSATAATTSPPTSTLPCRFSPVSHALLVLPLLSLHASRFLSLVLLRSMVQFWLEFLSRSLVFNNGSILAEPSLLCRRDSPIYPLLVQSPSRLAHLSSSVVAAVVGASSSSSPDPLLSQRGESANASSSPTIL